MSPTKTMRLLSTVVHERAGGKQDPFIQWAHELSGLGEGVADEIAWCSSILNAVMFLNQKQRSKSAAARSWLEVGLELPIPVTLAAWHALIEQHVLAGDALVAIFKRGKAPQPGPEVLKAPGHVGLVVGAEAGTTGIRLLILGGNQNNKINQSFYPVADLLGLRLV